MLFDYRFQWQSEAARQMASCDLMLFDYRFQSLNVLIAQSSGCDLMLFDYRFQWNQEDVNQILVVI